MKVKRSKYMYRKKRPWLTIVVIAVCVAALFGLGWLLSVALPGFGYGEPSSVLSTPSASSVASSTASAESLSTPVESSTPASELSTPSQVSEPLSSMKAVSPQGDALYDDTALAQFCTEAKAAGADTVIIDVKTADSYIIYTDVGFSQTIGASQAEYADIATTGGIDPLYTARKDLYSVVSTIKASGLQAVARINCFMDCNAGRILKGAKVTTADGTTWIDDSVANGGRSWLNPYSETARAYNLTIVSDCTAAGFDAIIADFVQFPVGYSLGLIDYGDTALIVTRAGILTQFMQDMVDSAGIPVYLTVRNLTANGSLEFGGSPFDYPITGLAGYVAVLNAPAMPRKTAASAMTAASAASAAAALPESQNIVTAVIAAQSDTTALTGFEQYAQLIK